MQVVGGSRGGEVVVISVLVEVWRGVRVVAFVLRWDFCVLLVKGIQIF